MLLYLSPELEQHINVLLGGQVARMLKKDNAFS